IAEHFSDLPKRTDSREAPSFGMPPHDESLISVATDKEATSSSVAVVVKRSRPPGNTVGRFRAGLKADLFSAMMNSRFEEISHRADPPFLTAGGGTFDFTRGTSLFYVEAQ